MPETVDMPTLTALARAGAVQQIKAIRAGDRWAAVAAVGLEEMTVRTQRKQVKQFATVDALVKFARQVGVGQVQVST